MSFTVNYQERAIREYETAMEWYRLRSEVAALNFEIAVKEKIDLLRESPGVFKKSYKQFHEVSLKKYPFSIVYIIDEKENRVVISSIFHHKRNPLLKFK